MPAIDLPPPPAAEVRAIEAGDLRLSFGAGSTPRNRGVGGWGLWATNLWGGEAHVDFGVFDHEGTAVSLGATGSYGQPFLAQAAVELIDPYLPNAELALDASSWTLAGRVAVHHSPRVDGVFHPYAAFEVGARRLNLDTSYTGKEIGALVDYRLTNAMLTPNVGIDLVSRSGVFLNAELGYGFSALTRARTDLVVDVDRISGEPIVDKSWDRSRSGPKGVVASVSTGVRF